MVLKHIFVGAERAQMHAELSGYLCRVYGPGDAKHRATADAYAADLARDDPSLLVDHLDATYGVPVSVRCRDTSVRAKKLNTPGTWCMYAAERGFHKVLDVALRAGVRPDDPDVFLLGGLLSYQEVFRDPSLLTLALQYKANPDVPVQPLGDRSTRLGTPGQLLLTNLASGMPRTDDTFRRIECLKLLVQGGAKVLGRHGEGEPPSGEKPSAAFLLADLRLPNEHRLVEAVTGLVPLMARKGFDIDTPSGATLCPPVIAATRVRNRPMVEAFLLAGCNAEDAHCARGAIGGYDAVGTLFDEVDISFGPGARSWVIEACMKRQMELSRVSGAPSAEPPVAEKARRRLRAV